MSTPYLGQIVMFGGTFAPSGWAFCNGQLLLISQNQALFSIMGTTYGGDGETTFALPDLRGRSPLHPGQGPGLPSRSLGEKSGSVNELLGALQVPAHNHQLVGDDNPATTSVPTGNVLTRVTNVGVYATSNDPATLDAATLSNVGGNTAHENRQPFRVINFLIATQGLFPS